MTRILIALTLLLPVAAQAQLAANEVDCSEHFSKWDVAVIERIELDENPHMYVTLKDTDTGDVYKGHGMPVGDTYSKYSDPSLSDLKIELNAYWDNGFSASQVEGTQDGNDGTLDDGTEYSVRRIRFGGFQEDADTLDMRLNVNLEDGRSVTLDTFDFPADLPDPANSDVKGLIENAAPFGE